MQKACRAVLEISINGVQTGRCKRRHAEVNLAGDFLRGGLRFGQVRLLSQLNYNSRPAGILKLNHIRRFLQLQIHMSLQCP